MAEFPYDIDREVSSLCSTGLRPMVLTGVVLRLLTRHFSVAKGISHPQLKEYIWSSDPTQSKILIVPVWLWQMPGQQQRPALVVRRNALRPQQIGIADGEAVVVELSSRQVPAAGHAEAQVAATGSHTIFAIADVPAQAEVLATEIYSRLLQYQQAIQSEFGFKRFRVAEMGALAKLEEADESFVVPVTLAYSYIEAWLVVTEAPYLKRVTIEKHY